MTLRDKLLENTSFIYKTNVFFQKDIVSNEKFGKDYIAVREKEGRVYLDEIVKQLPVIPDNHVLKNEWAIRKSSLERLELYLKSVNAKTILEVGCGNGWLSNNLFVSLNAEICALDINEAELLQAARLFNNENLSFAYADIFTCDFNHHLFDVIILPSSIQYFSDLQQLISRLLTLLASEGEIHIMDSPLYVSSNDAQAAWQRSTDYFISLGFPEMTNHYFHHTKRELRDFNYKVLHDPRSVSAIIKKMIKRKPSIVFPWIQIKHA